MADTQWKLVPAEPTPQMVEAAREQHEGEAYLPTALYRAMLAAAPQPPVAEDVREAVVELERVSARWGEECAFPEYGPDVGVTAATESACQGTREHLLSLFDAEHARAEAGEQRAQRAEAALRDLCERIKRAGGTVPAPEATGTVEGAVRTGLSIALVLAEAALEQVPAAQQEGDR